MPVNTQCFFLGYSLKNPIVLASGIIGNSATLLHRAAESGAGAVTAKSCGLEPRAGHPNPVALDWGGGVINAVGLTNPGASEEVHLLNDVRRDIEDMGVLLFASVFADTAARFGEVTRIIAAAKPHLIELNISCPNVMDEFGTPFAARADTASQVTESAKQAAGDIPISVKLAPNVPNIAYIAAAVKEAGADAITAINTMPGMVLDATAGRAVLSNKIGGISGPAIKPIALRCVYEIARAVDIPIIGTGGISTGSDAAEMIMAGATAVGVGSAVWYRGVSALGQIAAELATFMETNHYEKLESLRGLALR